MLGWNEIIDQLAMAMAYGVRRYCHVLRKEDSHVLRRALAFEVEGQRKKATLKRKKQAEEGSVKVGLRREDALCESRLAVIIS